MRPYWNLSSFPLLFRSEFLYSRVATQRSAVLVAPDPSWVWRRAANSDGLFHMNLPRILRTGGTGEAGGHASKPGKTDLSSLDHFPALIHGGCKECRALVPSMISAT